MQSANLHRSRRENEDTLSLRTVRIKSKITCCSQTCFVFHYHAKSALCHHHWRFRWQKESEIEFIKKLISADFFDFEHRISSTDRVSQTWLKKMNIKTLTQIQRSKNSSSRYRMTTSSSDCRLLKLFVSIWRHDEKS